MVCFFFRSIIFVNKISGKYIKYLFLFFFFGEIWKLEKLFLYLLLFYVKKIFDRNMVYLERVRKSSYIQKILFMMIGYLVDEVYDFADEIFGIFLAVEVLVGSFYGFQFMRNFRFMCFQND